MGISIIMPTYNRLALLREAVSSVLAQRYQEWELLISDDGSTDGTRDYLAGLSDPRIRVYFQSSNLGQFGNFNFLLGEAKYEVAQILCDDDSFIDDESLQKIAGQWAALPEDIGFLRSNHSHDSNSALSRFEKSVLPRIVAADQSDLFMGIFGSISGSISNMSVRVSAAKAVGLFRPELFYSGDFEFWARLGRSYPWCISTVEVVSIGVHEGQVGSTRNQNGEVLSQLRTILEPIYVSLVRLGYSPLLLRLLFTVNYTSQHRWRGLKNIVAKRGPLYLKRVSTDLDSANFSMGSALGWVVFVVSLRGKLFRIPLAKALLRQRPV